VNKTLIISNLPYLEDCSTDRIQAGYAGAYTDTTAGSGYADAGAMAVARGQRTFTDTRTSARVEFYGGFTFSLADAQASAYASTGSSRHSAWSSSTSTAFSSSSSFYTQTN
jgi:hypothetical protein